MQKLGSIYLYILIFKESPITSKCQKILKKLLFRGYASEILRLIYGKLTLGRNDVDFKHS